MSAPPEASLFAPTSKAADTPLISVCIANYNGGPFIEECIRSVISQKGEFSVEIILHDDCSTDDSASIVQGNFPEVLVLISNDNVGFCISNNRMVAKARGQYVLLLNNDAFLRPGSLTALLSYAASQTNQGILGLPQFSLHDGSLVDRGYCFDIFLNPVPLYDDGPIEVGMVTGACLWIPRQLWEEIGGFPPWFGSVAEDTFLCCAARLRGYPITVLNKPGFDHLIGANLGGGKILGKKLSSTARRRSLSERNKTSVMIMTYPKTGLLILLPIHLLLLWIEGMVLFATGTRWANVKAIYFDLPTGLLKTLASLLETRKRIQNHRKVKFSTYFRHFRIVPRKLQMLVRHGFPDLR